MRDRKLLFHNDARHYYIYNYDLSSDPQTLLLWNFVNPMSGIQRYIDTYYKMVYIFW